jgi:hypothetical protein
MEKFLLLLSDLNATNKTSYLFLDANINLLNLHQPDVSNYMNTILENGFLQIVLKATRIHNDSKTLIDHVLSNARSLQFRSGTLITDISDHFSRLSFLTITIPASKTIVQLFRVTSLDLASMNSRMS